MKSSDEGARRERQLSNRAATPPKPEKPVQFPVFCDLVAEWKPVGWAEETGQIKAGVGPFLDRRQRERRAFCYRERFPTRGDKSIRAQSIRGRMALEGLYVPTNKPWYPDFRAELLAFPAGKHEIASMRSVSSANCSTRCWSGKNWPAISNDPCATSMRSPGSGN